jgi:3-dehydrosphinganine reductase
MDYYRNKLVLITGGSSGIGLSLARQLAQAQANVWVLARRPEQLEKAFKEIEAGRVHPSQKFGCISADVTNEQQINQELSQFIESTGVPDILIHCAGYARPGLFNDLDTDVFRHEMDVNYFGMVYTSKKLVPGMVARRSGHIINISSMGGVIGTIGYTAYCAAKFAVRGFTDTLRYELKNTGVKVSIVYPPNTRTPGFEEENRTKPAITRALEDNAGEWQPDDVAKVILKDAARGKYAIVPGGSSKAMYFAVGIGQSFNFLNLVLDSFATDAQKKLDRQATQVK